MCYSVAEPGEHWIANSLAVMAAVRAAGGDLGAAGLALAEMGGLKGRGARHQIKAPGGKALLIDESYNANPASMRATLRALGQTPATRRVAVLGAMKELGDFAPKFHDQLAEPLAEADVDFAILVGEEMRALARHLGKGGGHALGKGLSFAHCDGPAEAIAALEEFGITAGDAILVKGSNSVGLGRLVARFTNREELNALSDRRMDGVRRDSQPRPLSDLPCRRGADDRAGHRPHYRTALDLDASRPAGQGAADPCGWAADAPR